MPIAPRNPYIKLTCRRCGWSTVTYQSSDVLMLLNSCAKCGNEDLQHSKCLGCGWADGSGWACF